MSCVCRGSLADQGVRGHGDEERGRAQVDGQGLGGRQHAAARHAAQDPRQGRRGRRGRRCKERRRARDRHGLRSSAEVAVVVVRCCCCCCCSTADSLKRRAACAVYGRLSCPCAQENEEGGGEAPKSLAGTPGIKFCMLKRGQKGRLEAREVSGQGGLRIRRSMGDVSHLGICMDGWTTG